MNKKSKFNYLKSNGWETWNSDEKWIKSEWIVQEKNLESICLTTEAAFNRLLKENSNIRLITCYDTWTLNGNLKA